MARYVRVSTISFTPVKGRPERQFERNLEKALRLIERATLDKPDIICLPETFASLGLDSEKWFLSSQPVPGPITEAVGGLAKRFNMYIICPMVERRSGRVYNSAVLIDRRGNPVGSYHKVHPTIGEITSGITPGTEATVFQTDFGRIGCATCFDLNFREVIEGLAAKGAEIVFFPSMYSGGLQLSIWAFDFGVYIASAHDGDGSAIVNPLGRVLVQSSAYEPIISERINLDYDVLHIDYNAAKWEEIKRKYGPKVEIEIATPEAVFLLVSHIPEVSVEQIIKEFKLETKKKYFNRANKVRKQSLKGQLV